MFKRSFLVVSLCLMLLAAPIVAQAGEWVDDHYYPSTTYPEGRGTTMALAAFYGLGIGFVTSGLVLIFYWNPDADKNYDTVMIATVPTCVLLGTIYGMVLPPDAYKTALFNIDDDGSLWKMPAISTMMMETPMGDERIWQTNVFQMNF